MAVNNLTVSTFSDLLAKYPNARQKIWAAKAIQTTNRVNLFAKMEGSEGSGKPVVRKDDLKKTRGDKIVFTVAAPLGSRATLGAETLRGSEETLKLGTFELQIDLRRHAAGLDDKHRMLTAVELDYIIAEQLGAHQGLTQQDDLMMMFRRKAIVANQLFGGNKSGIATLKSADVVNKTIVETAGEILKSRGGEPAMIQAYGEQEVQRYFYVSSHTALNNFRSSLSDVTGAGGGIYGAVASADGRNSPLFTGEHLDWNGHIIVPHLTVDHDGYGPVGSPLLPKAFLGNAISAGTTVIDITGGRDATGAALTRPLYFGYFNNYDYLFTEDQAAAPDTTDRYVIIYNLSGADAGKWGFYRYRTNNGNKLTIHSAASRLAAASSGVAATTVGSVTWSGSVNTDVHPSGSLIIEANASGVPIGYSLVLGKNAAFRGYGNPPFKRISDDEDYEFKKAEGYQVCYGQSPLYDTNGEPRNYALVTHAVSYPGVVLPVVS